MSNVVNNLAEVIHKIKNKNEQDFEQCEACGIK